MDITPTEAIVRTVISPGKNRYVKLDEENHHRIGELAQSFANTGKLNLAHISQIKMELE